MTELPIPTTRALESGMSPLTYVVNVRVGFAGRTYQIHLRDDGTVVRCFQVAE